VRAAPVPAGVLSEGCWLRPQVARHGHHSTKACHCQPGPVPSV